MVHQHLTNFLMVATPVDSCSSTFVGRKTKRTVETPAPAPASTVTILPTTLNPTLLTESQTDITEATATDISFKKDEYDHVELCEGQYKDDFCLNGGTCIIHNFQGLPIAYDCVCDSHYTGTRCEYKAPEGSYSGGMKLRVRRSNRRTRKILHRRRLSRMFCFVSCSIC